MEYHHSNNKPRGLICPNSNGHTEKRKDGPTAVICNISRRQHHPSKCTQRTYISGAAFQIQRLPGSVKRGGIGGREIVIAALIEHADFVAEADGLRQGFGHDGQNKAIDLQQKIAKHKNGEDVSRVASASEIAEAHHCRRRGE